MQVVEANGARIPLLGLGTWDLRGRTCSRIVEQALRLGYRHIANVRRGGFSHRGAERQSDHDGRDQRSAAKIRAHQLSH